jgi:hypothetical protein
MATMPLRKAKEAQEGIIGGDALGGTAHARSLVREALHAIIHSSRRQIFTAVQGFSM